MAKIYIIAIMLFVAMASAAPCTEGARYRVTELKAPAGATYCYPAAINNGGLVVGGTYSTILLWRNGRYTDLGKMGHETCLSCSAADINDKGVVVGCGNRGPYPESGFFTFIWKDGQAKELGPRRKYNPEMVYDINNKEEVVGSSEIPGGPRCPVIWDAKNGGRDLGSLGNEGNGEAYGINNKSQVVGESSFKAFIWQNGKMTELPTLPGWESSRANAINDNGIAVGTSEKGRKFSEPKTISRACLWDRNGKVVDLGILGDSSSVASDINDKGQVVGTCDVAFIWQDGKMTDLNKLIPPDCGWSLAGATGINNAGQIVGVGKYKGRNQGFLLTPIAKKQ